ncbi:MAG TPA: methyltransferase domain-containing protein [Pseudonocardia sp.]|jgi:SAM-dependent methyltransferase|nr:methyltransferase domain-containing protein [Pseudonocardia sp.]
MSYALRLSTGEQARYRFMAEQARGAEAPEWAAAGIGPGARLADIGCGPGAMLRVLAEAVGPTGAAHGVDQDADAVAAATEAVDGLGHASARGGSATDSGLRLGTYDVVVCRHVLAHNGGREAAIVRHLAALARPGGAVLLVDADAVASRIFPDDPDLADLTQRYHGLHRAKGNDLDVGIKLGWLLERAGLALTAFRSTSAMLRMPPGLRPPSWAARDAMVAAGLADADDLARWERAFERVDQLAQRPWLHLVTFIAVGHRPT